MRKKHKGTVSGQWKLSGDNLGLFVKSNTTSLATTSSNLSLNIKDLGAYIAATRDNTAPDGISDRAIWFHLSADPGIKLLQCARTNSLCL